MNLHPCHQTTDAELGFKRIQAHKSGPFDFENIQFAQELESPHLGPIWCMKFSHCGQLLATAGQDKNIMIWVVKDSYDHFKGDENNSRRVVLTKEVPRLREFRLLAPTLPRREAGPRNKSNRT